MGKGTGKLWWKIRWGWGKWWSLNLWSLGLLLFLWCLVVWSLFLGLGNSIILLLLFSSFLLFGSGQLWLGLLSFLSGNGIKLGLLLGSLLLLSLNINWTKLFIFILLK